MFPFFVFLVCLISVFNYFQQVRMMIDEALFRYSADKTGLADFGLESAGKNLNPASMQSRATISDLLLSAYWVFVCFDV